MIDLHCHILPGVDDGARDLTESLAMVEAAKEVGITEIVCTPHCRNPYFDYDKMWDAFELLSARTTGITWHMGFEVNIAKLWELGMSWASYVKYDGSRHFLLELETRADAARFAEYESTIFQLQGMGYKVIIAHPERYRAIQEDVNIAVRLVDLGCLLQASADYVVGGRMGGAKKIARRIMEEGLYSFVASDAHRVEHYDYYALAMREFYEWAKNRR